MGNAPPGTCTPPASLGLLGGGTAFFSFGGPPPPPWRVTRSEVSTAAFPSGPVYLCAVEGQGKTMEMQRKAKERQ